MRTVCAWCEAVILEGPAEPVSHGICSPCLAREAALEPSDVFPSAAPFVHSAGRSHPSPALLGAAFFFSGDRADTSPVPQPDVPVGG